MDLICKWCGETKPEELFIKRVRALQYAQNNVRCCRQCQKAYQHKRYGVPKLRAKQLKASAVWRKAHPDQMARYAQKLNESRPDQQRARNRVAHLLRRGKWTRKPCEACGGEPTEAHHDSYARSHWDVVRWLCKQHHETWHGRLDPMKKEILSEPMSRVRDIRAEASSVQAQITALRDRHRELRRNADAIELEAWNTVVRTADPLFRDFVRQA